jgi:hypothetical protein
LTGALDLEPTNEAYAIAKIAGIKLCQAYARQYGANFISAMPTNLYGPGDNFDLQTSHVLPALIRKVHEAKMQNRREASIVLVRGSTAHGLTRASKVEIVGGKSGAFRGAEAHRIEASFATLRRARSSSRQADSPPATLAAT